MNRRNFVSAAASAGAASSSGAAAPGGLSIIELRYIRLRNGSMVQQTNDLLSKYALPAAQRAGMGPIGCFGSLVAEQGPFVLIATPHASLAAYGEAMEKMAADREYQKALDNYNSLSELRYMRIETSLLRAFPGWPRVTPPPVEGRSSPRIFELRTYEANNSKASKRKVRMFDEGESGIFKRLGMNPVFFGETIVGTNMPNLTYMLSYDSMAHREEVWKKFIADPEWVKMRSGPDVADALIVSNISNSLLRPLPFSAIR